MVLSSSGIGLQASSSPGFSVPPRDGRPEYPRGSPGKRPHADGQGLSGGVEQRDRGELPLEAGEDFAVGAHVHQADRQVRGFRQRDAEGHFSGSSPVRDPAPVPGAAALASAMDLSCRRISGSRWDEP